MKTFKDVLNEGWSEKEFIANTHPLRRKFKDGDEVTIKKGAEIWNNDGHPSTFKKEKRYSEISGPIEGVHKSKSKALGEIWYTIAKSKDWKMIVSEKDIFDEKEGETRFEKSAVAFLYLLHILEATEKEITKSEVRVKMWRVFRHGTAHFSTKFNEKGYSFATNIVADFYREADAKAFVEACYAILKTHPSAPQLDKGTKPEFNIETSSHSFSLEEAVDTIMLHDPEFTYEKATEKLRGTNLGKEIGII